MNLTKSEKFFYDNAGWSYHPETQTKEEGRIECAKKLAEAEIWAKNEGLHFNWEPSPKPYFTGKENFWDCTCWNMAGELLGSLGECDFKKGETPFGDPYRRVVEAEIALEVMSNEN